MIFQLDTEIWKQTAVNVGLLVSGITWVFRRIKPVIDSISHAKLSIDMAVAKLEDQDRIVNDKILPAIERIDKETKINGGVSTLKDRVILLQREIMTVAEGMVNPVYRCDIDGNCTFANNALRELFGLSSEEMYRSGWLSAVDINEASRVYDHWHDCVKNDKPYSDTYKIINQSNGKYYRVKTSANPIRDAQGKILFWSGTISSEEA